jgi:hypothetical protein
MNACKVVEVDRKVMEQGVERESENLNFWKIKKKI